MTAKERAEEILNRFRNSLDNSNGTASGALDCALIAVDEIIESLEAFGYSGAMYDDFVTGKIIFTNEKNPTAYWQEVKKELELLIGGSIN